MQLNNILFNSIKYDVVIGIDPDCDKSGVAKIDKSNGTMAVSAIPFPELLDMLAVEDAKAKANGRKLLIVVEAGYINKKTNFHYFGDNPKIASAIGAKVGRNHEITHKLVEICEHWNISVTEKEPLPKIWKGKGGKISAAEFQYLTGYSKRTNQDARDAALICWYAAGLPFKRHA